MGVSRTLGPLDIHDLLGTGPIEGAQVLIHCMRDVRERGLQTFVKLDPPELVLRSSSGADHVVYLDAPKGHWVPLTNVLDEDLEQFYEEVVPDLEDHAGVRLAHSSFQALCWLVDNAVEHARSSEVWVAGHTHVETAREHGWDNAVCEFVVVDAGIGMLTHLRGNPLFGYIESSREAIEASTRAGASGIVDRAEGRGLGLSLLVDWLCRHDPGELVLASGDGMGWFRCHRTRGKQSRESKFRNGLPEVAGTCAYVKLVARI